MITKGDVDCDEIFEENGFFEMIGNISDFWEHFFDVIDFMENVFVADEFLRVIRLALVFRREEVHVFHEKQALRDEVLHEIEGQQRVALSFQVEEVVEEVFRFFHEILLDLIEEQVAESFFLVLRDFQFRFFFRCGLRSRIVVGFVVVFELQEIILYFQVVHVAHV